MTRRARADALPPHLAERVSALGAGGGDGGEFVLYWMHHAARVDENPALDVAREAAADIGLPLLVYQGLGAGHAYDSDRHHTFILEGAREVAACLAADGVRYVFHLPRGGDRRRPLVTLARRAALVVTEDFPAPPLAAWTQALTRRADRPVWLVDTACVLPMRLVPSACDRAFRFRRDWGEELDRRSRLAWPECQALPRAFDGELGFEPLDLASADVAELCAACDIDHGVPPAPATRGGTAAGLRRWRDFVEHGLGTYHRLRNDAAVAPPRGVSRLSPYLHHGQMSPLRVAREAAAHGSDGARKFLDELLVWRELAHNFCFHWQRRDTGEASLALLPGWTPETLREHAADRREAELDWETLARAGSGDPLWDAAQRSLLVLGELHNNLRMSWGKSLLRWTRSPQRALALMLDLNHRYALDGSDPNSYGGLLYCLGLFDRPFDPPRRVYGRVRPRSTSAHAARLDLPAFEQRVATRDGAPRPRIAVIGAGIAGLAAARTLADNGLDVHLLERGRGVGGRCATRRGDTAFDHGAQYFTARDPRFRRHVAAWSERGHVGEWQGRVVRLAGAGVADTTPCTRLVGVPGMSAIARHLGGTLPVVTGATVSGVRRDRDGWRLSGEGVADPDAYDVLLLAMPPEQALRLVADEPRAAASAARLRALRSLPCHAALLSFATPLGLGFDAAFVDDDRLAWAARQDTRPGRADAAEAWVLHSTPAWSEGQLETAPEEIADLLCRRFGDLLGERPPRPALLAGHRWRYARVAQPLGEDCLYDADVGLGLAGDWCLDARIEGAFLSGVALAGRVLARARV